MQTINQYVASVRAANPPEDLEWQANVWPWPQAKQSHIALWLGRHATHDKIPARHLWVPLANSGTPGAVITVAPDALRPREVARRLRELADRTV